MDCTRATGAGAGANVSLGAVVIETTVLSAGNPVNTATISSASPVDSDLTNNSATDGGATIAEPVVDLSAVKTGPNPALAVTGQPYTFNIATSNLGNTPFFGTLNMVDHVPAGMTITAAGLNGWTCDALPVVGATDLNCTRTYTSGAPLGVGATTPSVVLTAQYEFTPTGFAVNDTAYGAHGEVWLSDNLRFGATYMSEKTAGGTQKMASADLRYQLGNASFAELEYAHTAGPGMGFSTSTDGGLTIISTAGVASTGASALHFDSHFDLQDLGMNRDGFVNVYYDSKQAGFSTISETITTGQSLVGVETEIALGERLTFGADAELFRQDNGNRRLESEVRLAFALSDQFSLEAGVQMLDQNTVGSPSETGKRTDLGLRVNYAPLDTQSFYLFGQATLSNAGGLANNNRYGAGFDLAVSEKLDLSGEVSTGNAGLGGALRLTYAATDSNEVYLGYTLDPTRGGAGGALNDNGRVVLGGKYQLSDSISTYTEYVYDMPDDQRSLSQIYGVTYTPTDAFTISSTVELGSVTDAVSGDFDRLALSFGAAKDNGDGQGWRARLEYRDENGVGTTRDHNLYL